MDPLALNWPEVVERLGIPLTMCIFMAGLYVRQQINARKDRSECSRDLRQLRSYTDKSLENMRKMQNQEREQWMLSLNTLTHDLTIVLNDLLNEMKTKREQEERTSAEVIAHIDKVIERRGCGKG